MISGNTKVFGVIGDPVAHSCSPLIHNIAFQKIGYDGVYVAFSVPLNQVGDAIRGFRAINIAGFNVTMPDKQAVMPHLDEISPEAQLIGAVNTVVNRNHHLIGYNTDGIGMVNALKAKGIDVFGKRILIFGAGGAASSIAVQCVLEKAACITIVNRSLEKAKALMKMLQPVHGDCALVAIAMENQSQMHHVIHEADILINATSVGMIPDENHCVIPDFSVLSSRTVVADAVYHPRETVLLKGASEKGCVIVPGIDMLLYQGAAAFKLFTGLEMPVENIKPYIEYQI